MPHMDLGTIVLVLIALFAAIVNGALGYGFSSLTVPVALLFYPNKVLGPALVLVELVVNGCVLLANRRGIPKVWRRVLPIVYGLAPGIIIGGYALSSASPGWLKFFTYLVLLPLILLQAAGKRRPIRREAAVGVPVGIGVGALYAATTISGPPLALLFNNQGHPKEEFRAALGIVRVCETTLTAAFYYFLKLYTPASMNILSLIVPSVIVGLFIGVFLIKRMHTETFRRICMSFDAWVVGFGISQTLIALAILRGPAAYLPWLAIVVFDLWLLYGYFVLGRFRMERRDNSQENS